MNLFDKMIIHSLPLIPKPIVGFFSRNYIAGSELSQAIEVVKDYNELAYQVVNSKSSHGTGGMQSKIDAISLARKSKIETWIVNGLEDNFIVNVFENKVSFTKIK